MVARLAVIRSTTLCTCSAMNVMRGGISRVPASVEAVEKCAWLCEECARKTLREQSSPREGNKEPKEGTSKHVDGDLVRNLSFLY